MIFSLSLSTTTPCEKHNRLPVPSNRRTTPNSGREREMENGSSKKIWGFKASEVVSMASKISIRGILMMIMENLNEADTRPTIPLGHGDPSAFPCFRTTPVAEDAIADAVRSAKFNCYAPTVGLLPARKYFFFIFYPLLLFSFYQYIF